MRFFLISLLLHLAIFSLFWIKKVSPVEKPWSSQKGSTLEVEILPAPSSNDSIQQASKNWEDQDGEIQVPKKKNKKLSMKDLLPSRSYQNPASALGSTGETLEKQQEESVMESFEFKYASYYNRIRDRLEIYWYSDIRERLRILKLQGKFPAYNKVTKVMVSLNHKGELVKVQVVGPSGLEDLDQSTLQAFRLANPFPNPPKDLISDEGLVVISWFFILEVN